MSDAAKKRKQKTTQFGVGDAVTRLSELVAVRAVKNIHNVRMDQEIEDLKRALNQYDLDIRFECRIDPEGQVAKALSGNRAIEVIKLSAVTSLTGTSCCRVKVPHEEEKVKGKKEEKKVKRSTFGKLFGGDKQ